MIEIPSPAGSSNDGEEVLLFSELLEEASLVVQGAANVCYCGENKHMMDVFDVIEGGSVVAAAGIVTARRSCRCDEAREFLRDALQVVAQLGETREEREPRALRKSLLMKLIPASALMIILGYPGEIAVDTAPKAIWGALSTIPFLYILYILFVELTKATKTQPGQVAKDVNGLRWLLLATWGVYPISYMIPMFGIEGADSFVWRQVGYSLADVLAKCLFGLLIYKIAREKSAVDSPEFNEAELEEAPSSR